MGWVSALDGTLVVELGVADEEEEVVGVCLLNASQWFMRSVTVRPGCQLELNSRILIQ